MSSKRRLAKLESSKPKSAIPTNAPEMLVSALAKRDALFWPTRKPKHDHYPEILALQRKYLAGEQGVSAKGEGKGGWKDAHFLRKELVDMGFLIACGTNQTKSVFLTPQGEAHARALVGGLEDLTHYLGWQELFAKKKTAKSFLWESVLFDRAIVGDSSQFSWLIDRILPLLVCGAVKCFPNTVCQLFYRWEGLPEPPVVLKSQLPARPELETLYFSEFNAEITRLDSLQGSHELYIPMPATGWACEQDMEWLKACGMEPSDPYYDDPPEVRAEKRRLAEAVNNGE